MRSLIVHLLLLLSQVCLAQKQNNNWVFGKNCGVTFNTVPPSSFIVNGYNVEGVASVSNRNTGSLLFFSGWDGSSTYTSLYNRLSSQMPNGANIGGDIASSVQAVNIVPFLNDTNKYYVFTVTQYQALNPGMLCYSVVDMTLNGGLGDVVSGQKHILIDTNISEAMTVTEGCNGYWLIVFNDVTNAFYAYSITASGVSSTPVISSVPYKKTINGQKAIKVSPDRAKLGVVSFSDFVYMHDFDAVTGKVTNGGIIDTSYRLQPNGSKTNVGFYGCEFSPDSRWFYVSAYNLSTLYQYDVTKPTIGTILASRKIVSSSVVQFGGSLQLAPDGNIYLSKPLVKALGRISNPNVAAPGCTYTDSAVWLGPNGESIYGLPQRIVRPFVSTGGGSAFVATHYLTACLGQKPLVLRSPGGIGYTWQDGSQLDSFVATTEGAYWVRTTDSCTTFIDSFIVKKKNIDTAHSRRDTVLCKDGVLTLTPINAPLGAVYKWSTGSVADQIKISAGGFYWVRVTGECSYLTDTIAVAEVKLTADVINVDTTICSNDSLILTGIVNPPLAAIKWSTGDTTTTTKVSAEGEYVLSAEFSGCKAIDRVIITHLPKISIELGSDTEICADEPLLLPRLVTSEQSDIYQWQDGSTTRKYLVSKTGRYTVQVTNKCGTIYDTVDITARNCHLFFPDVFSPNGDGHNDFARLLGDIANVSNYELHIFHRWGQEVFVGNDVYKGWDGMHNGKPAGQDTYCYYMKFRYLGKDKMMKGTLMLLR